MNDELEYDALLAALRALPGVQPPAGLDRRTRARAQAMLARRPSARPPGTWVTDGIIAAAAALYVGVAVVTALQLLASR